MQENHLYEYATVRYVPRVEREEFINVGLAMMCKRQRWLKLRVKADRGRLSLFSGEADVDEVMAHLHGFESIADGCRDAGPMADCPVEERFRWLTAEKSACLQTSRPHAGLTADLDGTFERLFSELVD